MSQQAQKNWRRRSTLCYLYQKVRDDGRSLWHLRFRQLNERCMQLFGKARSQLKDTVGSTDTV